MELLFVNYVFSEVSYARQGLFLVDARQGLTLEYICAKLFNSESKFCSK